MSSVGTKNLSVGAAPLVLSLRFLLQVAWKRSPLEVLETIIHSKYDIAVDSKMVRLMHALPTSEDVLECIVREIEPSDKGARHANAQKSSISKRLPVAPDSPICWVPGLLG